MKTEHSEAFLKRRKFFTVLPLIVVPFMVLLFWLLGGGKGEPAKVPTNKGLNTQLPDAKNDSKSALDKMSFYAQADQDSVNRLQQMRMDPNYQETASEKEPVNLTDKKVSQLQKEVDQEKSYERPVKKGIDPEIDSLQNMVATLQQKKADPDIEALNGTLDKLLEIQHPTLSKIMSGKQKRMVYTVRAGGVGEGVSFFGKSRASNKAFLSEDNQVSDTAKEGTILAVVHNEQTLVEGAIIKLRLLQDVFVKGQTITAGSFLYGNISIAGERLQVTIPSIQYMQQLYPVELKVFDMDGMEGIHIPGSIGRNASKQAAEQGIESASVISFDPSLTAQAAEVGVNAAKSLLSKKAKQERVTVKAGYKVLLKDASIRENDKSGAW